MRLYMCNYNVDMDVYMQLQFAFCEFLWMEDLIILPIIFTHKCSDWLQYRGWIRNWFERKNTPIIAYTARGIQEIV